jgi:hypothetical protein
MRCAPAPEDADLNERRRKRAPQRQVMRQRSSPEGRRRVAALLAGYRPRVERDRTGGRAARLSRAKG